MRVMMIVCTVLAIASGAHAQYSIAITTPADGACYCVCAPDTVWWESDIPGWPGSPNTLDLYWRPCGGEWQWFANDNNDGAHPWASAPCDSGCYQVKIEYIDDPSINDVVTFEVDPCCCPVDDSTWGRIKEWFR